MTEDASAGRLHIEVVGDADGFSRGLQARIDAQTRDIRARIKTELDTRGLATQTRAAARAAEEKARVRARVEFRASQARAELNRALREAGPAAAPARARAEFRVTQVRAALNRALREAAQTARPAVASVEFDAAKTRAAMSQATRDAQASARPVEIPSDVETGGAAAELGALKRGAESDPIELDVRINPGALISAGRLMTQLGKFPAIASGIGIAAGALTNLGAGLFAVTSAASQAVGVVGMLPGLVGTAAQGIGALVAGFSGVGDAVEALGKVEAEGASTAQAAAETRAAAAERIQSAQQQVADAYRNADQVAEQGAYQVQQARAALADAQRQAAERVADAERGVEDAERSLADAQRQARYAQEQLTAAREQARERLEDLRLSLRGAALDEEGATLAVERARMRLQEVGQENLSLERRQARLALDRAEAERRALRRSGESTRIQRREAQLAVESARERLDAIDQQVDALSLERREADLNFRQAEYRLDQVRESNEDLRQEYRRTSRAGVSGSEEVVTARRAIADANRGVAEAQRGVYDAERELQQARAEGTREITEAQASLRRTIAQTARDNADANRQLRRAQADLRTAMSEATAAVGEQSAAVGNLNEAMANLSPEGRRFARFVADTLQPRLKELRFAVQGALLPPLQEAITEGMPLLDTLEEGLVDTGERIGDLSIDLAELVASPAFREDLGTVMASNNRAMTDFGDAGIYLASAFRHIAVEAGPLLEDFAAWTETLAKAFDQTVETKRETGELGEFFGDAGDRAAQLGDILWDVTVGLKNVAEASMPAGDTLLSDLEAQAQRFADWTGDPENQRKMREFFNEAVPVVEDLAAAFVDLGQVLIELGDLVGADTLNGLVWFLDQIVAGLKWISDQPGGETLLTAIFTVGGVLLGMGLLVGYVGKLVKHMKALKRIGPIAGMFGGGKKGGRRGGPGGSPVPPIVPFGGGGGRHRRPGRVRMPSGRVGIVGLIGSIIAGQIGAAISTGGGGPRDALGGGISWGVSGAALGGLLGSIVPGIGTAIGAATGAAIGAGVGAIVKGGYYDDIKNFYVGQLKALPGEVAKSFLPRWVTSTPVFGWLKDGARRGLKAAGIELDKLPGQTRAAIATTRIVAGPAWNSFWTYVRIRAQNGAIQAGIKVANFGRDVRQKFRTTRALAGIIWRDFWGDVGSTVRTSAIQTGIKVANFGRDVRQKFRTTRALAGIIWRDFWGDVRHEASVEAVNIGIKLANFGRDVRQTFRTTKTLAGVLWDRFWRDVGNTAQTKAVTTGIKVSNFGKDVRDRFRTTKTLAGVLWDRLWGGVDDTTDKQKRKVGGKIDDFNKGAERSFEGGVSGIDKAWSRLRNIAKSPVNFVIKWVYNRGIRKVWNAVARPFDAKILPHVEPLASGGPVPAPEVGWTNQPTAVVGEGSQHPEVVIPTDPKHRGRALQLYEQLGGRLMQGGGWIDRLRGVYRGAKDFVVDKASDLMHSASSLFSNPRGTLRDLVSPFTDQLERITDSRYGRMVASIPREIVDTLAGQVKQFVANLGGGAFGSSRGWPAPISGVLSPNTAAAVDFVQRRFGINNIGTLGDRPNKSDHPLGKALDVMIPNWSSPAGVALGNQVASWFTRNAEAYGTKYVIWRDRITSGEGWRPYTHPLGASSSPTLRHMDHVHVSLYDSGFGVLPAGSARIAANGTNEDEYMFSRARLVDLVRSSTSAAAEQLVDRDHVSGMSPLIGSLALVTDKPDVREEMEQVLFTLRRVRRGGVHNGRAS